MPHEPKKRHSRARQGKRRAAIKLTAIQMVLCKNCGNRRYPHSICAKCGYYRGVQIKAPKQTKTA